MIRRSRVRHIGACVARHMASGAVVLLRLAALESLRATFLRMAGEAALLIVRQPFVAADGAMRIMARRAAQALGADACLVAAALNHLLDVVDGLRRTAWQR